MADVLTLDELERDHPTARELRADRDALAAIVRAVAASKPSAQMVFGGMCCAFCEVRVPDSEYTKWPRELHRPDCPWRLSREWVEREGSEGR